MFRAKHNVNSHRRFCKPCSPGTGTQRRDPQFETFYTNGIPIVLIPQHTTNHKEMASIPKNDQYALDNYRKIINHCLSKKIAFPSKKPYVNSHYIQLGQKTSFYMCRTQPHQHWKIMRIHQKLQTFNIWGPWP